MVPQVNRKATIEMPISCGAVVVVVVGAGVVVVGAGVVVVGATTVVGVTPPPPLDCWALAEPRPMICTAGVTQRRVPPTTAPRLSAVRRETAEPEPS